jgi:homospermidine synthase
MIGFNKKILIIGYGAVSRCTIPILLKHVRTPPENITVIDFEDKSAELRKYAPRGIKFFRQKVTRENMGKVLSQHLERGGLLVDLAWNIDCCEIVQWCHEHEVFYVNTSVEEWDSYSSRFTATPYEKSLYYRQMQLRELTKSWKNATTFVVDHGANPGLISHFAKQGAIDIANKLVKENKAKNPAKLEKLVDAAQRAGDFAALGHELKIKVIHCSERDTQITDRPKQVDEFVGTWSIEGLREEGTAPAEMGWGTHEKTLPKLAHRPPVGPKNQIFLAQMGMNTWVRSWVPDYEIIGMVIRHGEAFGISDRWTLRKNGKVVYRPTVHYAYQPCDETIMSLQELRGLNYEMQSRLRILQDHEITSGDDILGALLMGHDYNSWWTGSILSIEESRKLAPGQNATTIQVALGVITAAMWMIENPRKGFCLPDDLPHDYVLKIAKPYLGKFVSKAYDWTPLKNRKTYFKENPVNKFDNKDLWQFKNFMFVA